MTIKEPFSAKEKVKSDIKRYENQKKIKNIMTFGSLGLSGLAAGLAYKKEMPMAAGAISGAFFTGLARGRAKREENSALGRIKRYYDLRERNPLINLSAILPDQEKTAIEKDAVIFSGLAEIAGAMGHQIPHGVGPMLDLLTAPYLAGKATQGLRNLTTIAAKAKLGKKLTTSENFWAGLMHAAEGVRGMTSSAAKLPGKAFGKKSRSVIGKVFGRARVNKVLDENIPAVINYLPKYLGPIAGGSEIGQKWVAPAYEMVHKYSPEHADLMLDLLKGGKAGEAARIKLQINQVQVQDFLKDMAQVSSFGNAASSADKKLEDIVKKYILPEKLKGTAQKIKDLRQNVHNAGRAGGIGLGSFLAGSLIGGRKKKHPLASNNLPMQLAGTVKKKEAPFKTPPYETDETGGFVDPSTIYQ